MSEENSEIIISSSPESFEDGIFKFETCKLRNKEKFTKRGCCSSSSVEGYYCSALNKFPVSFSKDCNHCLLYKN